MQFVLEPGAASLLFWLATLAWLLESLLAGRRRSRRSLRGSLEFLLVLAAMLVALALGSLSQRAGFGVVTGEAGTLVVWIGLLLYAGAVALRHWAVRSLGQWFTRDLEVHDDHRLVRHGPYALVRHPLYAALVVATLGLGLLFRTPTTAALGAVLVLVALAPRIRREERLLEARLGGDYRRWASTRARLLPGLF